MNLLHLLRRAVELVTGQLGFDSLCDVDHEARLLLQRVEVRERIRDLVLRVRRLLLFAPLDGSQTTVDAAFFFRRRDHCWLGVAHRLSHDLLRPSLAVKCLLNHFEEPVSRFVVEPEGNRGAELRGFGNVAPSQHILVVIDHVWRVIALVKQVELDSIFREETTLLAIKNGSVR